MSGSNSSPSPSWAEQRNSDANPPKSPTAHVDSKNGPEAKKYFASSTDRFQRPRGPMRKLTRQGLPPFLSTVDTGAASTIVREPSVPSENRNEEDRATTSQSPMLSQHEREQNQNEALHSLVSSQNDGRFNADFTLRNARPSSVTIAFPPGLYSPNTVPPSPNTAKDEIAKVLLLNKRLQKSFDDLQEKSDQKDAEIARLEGEVELTLAAKNAVKRDYMKFEKALKDIEEPYAEVVKTNVKLDQLNKDLERQTSQAQCSRRDSELLNATQASQMQELIEQVFRETKLRTQLEAECTKLARDRTAAAEANQEVANSEKIEIEGLQQDISALAIDLEAARAQIQELHDELEVTRLPIVQFAQQQLSLEHECSKYNEYDASKISLPHSSSAHSPRDPIRRVDVIPEEMGLSDTPALADDASPRSTPSLLSPAPIAIPLPKDESTGPSDDTRPERTGPAERQHKSVFWPTIDERKPYRIVGERPRDFRVVAEEAEAPVSANDTSEVPEAASRNSTSDAGTQFDLLPMPITAASPLKILSDAGTQADLPALPVAAVSLPNMTSDAGTQADLPALPVAVASTPNSTSDTGTQANLLAFSTTRSTGDASTQADIPPSVAAVSTPRSTSDAGTQADLPPLVAAASPPSHVAARARRPLWHQVALGTTLVLFLMCHVAFAERRLWGRANELTRCAIVSMRDEWWGSPWVERIGYTLDQKLAVDRRRFC